MKKCIAPALRHPLILLLLSACLGWSQAKQERPLIIDMHLHAVAADATGPPPVALCVPMLAHLPDGDPNKPWQEKMAALLKNPPCPDPVWSPRTDQELMEQTIAVMERLPQENQQGDHIADRYARGDNCKRASLA